MYPSDDESIDLRLEPSLTDDQVRLMALLFVISGTLSIFGSLIIVHRVVRNRECSKSYDRIMLGMSIFDIIMSLSYILRPFTAPKATSTRVTAIGNDVTCTFQGWLTQFGFASIPYNAFLSFYMLAVVRFAVKPSDFAARYEAYFHALTIFYFLATATFSVPFGIYSELRLGFGCWVVDLPECIEYGGTSCKGVGTMIGWLFAGIPLLVTFVALIVNNIMIFVYVLRKLKIEGRGRTQMQQVQIRRVATQGFLYVGAFFVSYSPGFTVRLLGIGGGGGYTVNDEAGIYNLLLAQATLVPLQGFFNMLIYIRPTYLQLRKAGATGWMAMRGACFAPDIPQLISEVTSTAPDRARSSNKESLNSDENQKDNSSNHESDNEQLPGSSGGTEEDGDSGEEIVPTEEFVEEDFQDGSERIEIKSSPTSSGHKPPESILKSSSSARVKMDGSISSNY